MLDKLNLDHIAINVRENMDEAYKLFSELGFRLTPRGYHSLWLNKSFNGFHK